MSKPTMIIGPNGSKRWWLNGELHRTDGPAVEWYDGSKEWHLNGVELTEGEFNKRMNKPTMIIGPNGDKYWHLNGELHRTDGPAIEYANGTKRWHLNGKLHRTDGPAIEDANGSKEWHLNGVELNEGEFNKRMNKPTMIIGPNGDKYWCLNGQRHRTDGPAIEYADGDKEWWLNGKIHRTDGPAIEYPSGTKYWHLNGELHRTDGPAVEDADGYKEWHLNGEELTETEFNKRMGNSADIDLQFITINNRKYKLVLVRD